jgi:eukaryotic-like serine/threonine-protein kinase
MTPSDWQRVEIALDAALTLPAPERDLALVRQLAGAPDLLAKARAMLGAMADADDFLESDAVPSDPAAAAPQPGSRYGAWAVEGALGRGGMGVVLGVSRAAGGFAQRGALKLMRDDAAIDIGRFERERQLLADLDHPGLARLLDGGVDETGRPWLVMERIDGVAIDAWCDQRQIDLAARIRLALAVADAVAAAHRRLVLHRDLKPGNVMVDGDGRPRVIDFGIARQMDAGQATDSALPLSAPWAAPELFTGSPAGPPVDVYGVAALLYHLAAGRPPVDLSGLPLALGIGRVLDQEPARLTQLQAAVPVLAAAPAALVADLDAILAKALRKDPAARYASLDVLAGDLRSALLRGVVAARAGDRAYRVQRTIWRMRWPLAAAAAVMLALGGGLAAALVQKREAVAARDAALAEEARSEAVRQSLYLLLAESVETTGGDASARDVLARAQQRIAREFARRPADAARVLHALGELYFYLGDYDGARQVLTPLVTAAAPDLPPDTLAAARYDLAQALVRVGDTAAAAGFLAKAQGWWRQDPVKWRAKLIDSRVAEAQIVRQRDPVAAAALLQAAMTEQRLLGGDNNRQAGMFQNNLGVALQAAGDMDGAARALRAAAAIWQRTGLEETPDALNTLNNLAAIETLQGRPQAAEPLFAKAVAVRKALYGASGATAALLNNHGKVLLLLGQSGRAEPVLAEAAAMAQSHAGPGSIHHVAALSGLAEAQLARDPALGLNTARGAVAAAAAGKAPPPALAMADLALARALIANGNRAQARGALARAQAIIPALGPAGARLARAGNELAAKL